MNKFKYYLTTKSEKTTTTTTITTRFFHLIMKMTLFYVCHHKCLNVFI